MLRKILATIALLCLPTLASAQVKSDHYPRELVLEDCADFASAGTVTADGCNSITFTGTTTINTINTCSAIGRQLRILCNAVDFMAFGDGAGNLELNDGFTCSANDTLTLYCDGSNWVEISRGVTIGGGAPPTGTGFRHVTGDAEDGAAETVTFSDADQVTPNQGTTTQVLHGDAAGQPAFSQVKTTDIIDDNVTYGKIQNVTAADRLLGRATAGAGIIEEITVGGDLSQSGSSFTIQPDTVSYDKMQDTSAGNLLLGQTGAAGDTVNEVTNAIGTGTPASGDFLLGWESTGELRKFDVGALPGGADGVGYDEVMEEGAGVAKQAQLNFIGSSITCVDNPGATRTDCTLTPGAGLWTDQTTWVEPADVADEVRMISFQDIAGPGTNFGCDTDGVCVFQSIADANGPGDNWSIAASGAAVFLSVTITPSATPQFNMEDSTNDDSDSDFRIAIEDNASPFDSRAQFMVEIAGTLDTWLDLDGLTNVIVLGDATNVTAISLLTSTTGDGALTVPNNSIDDAEVANDITIDLATVATTANNLAAGALDALTEIADLCPGSQGIFRNSGDSAWECAAGGADGVGYDEVMDEGSGITKRAQINFIGGGVNCVDNAGRSECTITGAGGPATAIQTSDTTLTIRGQVRIPTVTDGLFWFDSAERQAALGASDGDALAGDTALGFFDAGTLEVARGGTNLTAAADDQMMIGNGTTWETKALPAGGTDGCSGGADKPIYTASTNAWTCGTDGGGTGVWDDNGTDLQPTSASAADWIRLSGGTTPPAIGSLDDASIDLDIDGGASLIPDLNISIASDTIALDRSVAGTFILDVTNDGAGASQIIADQITARASATPRIGFDDSDATTGAHESRIEGNAASDNNGQLSFLVEDGVDQTFVEFLGIKDNAGAKTVRMGDLAGNNYIGTDEAGAMTFTGTSDIDLPNDSVDVTDIADAELTLIADLAETSGNVMFAAGDAWTSDATPAIVCDDCTADLEVADNDTTQVATTSYVQQEINGAGGDRLTCSSGSCAPDATTYTETKCVYIDTPVDADDLLIYRTDVAVTMTSVDCIVEDGTSAIVVIVECDSAGDNCGSSRFTESVTCDTDGATDDGLAETGVVAGAWIRAQVGTVDTSTEVNVCFSFTVDP